MKKPLSSDHPANPLTLQSELFQRVQIALGAAAQALAKAAALLPKLQAEDGDGSAPILIPRLWPTVIRFPLAELELLHTELDTFATENAPTSLFCDLVTDLSRRARLVQELHPVAQPKTRRFIRRLAAAAAGKGLHLHGLRRRDIVSGDVVPVPARRRMEPRVDAQALEPNPEPPALSSTISENTPNAPASSRSTTELAIPHVRELLRGRAVVIVGGQVKRQLLERLVTEAEIDIEWIQTSKDSPRPIDALIRRIQDGHVAVLIVIEGFISHKYSVPLASAARAQGLAIAYAGRGGLAKLRQGLLAIEQQLVGQQAARGAA